MATEPQSIFVFAGLTNLASERVGARALQTSDDFFAEKENLTKAELPVFIDDEYTDRGKWMDGWESRRKREEGYDWCILRLGIPGIVQGLDVDTTHFKGNNPAFASVDATRLEPGRDPDASTTWTEILPKRPTRPSSRNIFGVVQQGEWTHVRLNIFPDGGVARFRVFGTVIPRKVQGEMDLVALENGGQALAASDMFFSDMSNLIMPGRGRNMGDGWETKRRRGEGHDWVLLKLGAPGVIQKLLLDTAHFKGNFPHAFSVEICHCQDSELDLFGMKGWQEILPRSVLKADAEHSFSVKAPSATHLRLRIYPDGGVSRLRAFGVAD